MPGRMAALERTAVGFDVLERATTHPRCLDRSHFRCRGVARALLEEALALSENENPVAAFGLALIEFDESLRRARNLKPSRVVDDGLQDGHGRFTAAIRSGFVRGTMLNREFIDRLTLLKVDGIAFDDSLHTLVTNFRCAMSSYRRADWAGCSNRLEDIDSYPASLRRYLEAARFEARLHMAGTDRERRAILDDIEARLRELDDPAVPTDYKVRNTWLLRRVLARQACLRPGLMEPARFALLARRIIDHAPSDMTTRLEAMIEVAGCIDDADLPAHEKIDEIATGLSSGSPQQSLLRLELALAMYFVRTDDLDTAIEHAERSLELPYAGRYVQSSAAFSRLMDSPRHKDRFVITYLNRAELLELEDCDILSY